MDKDERIAALTASLEQRERQIAELMATVEQKETQWRYWYERHTGRRAGPQMLALTPVQIETLRQKAWYEGARRVHEYFQSVVIPYMQGIADMYALLALIDALGGSLRGQELRVGLAGLDEKLAAETERLLRLHERLAGPDSDSAFLVEYSARRIEAIRNVLNEYDDGEDLRQIIQDKTGTVIRRLYTRLAEVDRGGAPVIVARLEVARRWHSLQVRNGSELPAATERKILQEDLEEKRDREGLTEIESGALNWLKNVSSRRASDQRLQLSKDYPEEFPRHFRSE